jgi:DNA-directed RNA polymerase subunit M/transcription elongation factor TFIIS
MLKALSNWARCPDCDGFLVKIGRKFVCKKCGFSQPATPAPKIEN